MRVSALSNPDEILTGIWRTLGRGVADHRHDWHWPVLATTRSEADGTLQAEARTVVLRAVNEAQRWVEVHSDSRAGKISDLIQQPKASLHLYDSRARIQARLYVTAQIHIDDSLCAAAWAKLSERSQAQYLELEQRHFAVLRLITDRIDWLSLDPAGHVRWMFHWASSQPDAPARWLSQPMKP